MSQIWRWTSLVSGQFLGLQFRSFHCINDCLAIFWAKMKVRAVLSIRQTSWNPPNFSHEQKISPKNSIVIIFSRLWYRLATLEKTKPSSLLLMKLMNLSPPPSQAGRPSRVDLTILKPHHTDENLFWLHQKLVTWKVVISESVPISQVWDRWGVQRMDLGLVAPNLLSWPWSLVSCCCLTVCYQSLPTGGKNMGIQNRVSTPLEKKRYDLNVNWPPAIKVS